MLRRSMSDHQDKSRFNMGIAMLTRIDSILTQCAIAKGQRNFSGWFDHLIVLSGEINFTFKEEVARDDKAFKNAISPLIDEFNYEMVESGDKYIIKNGHTFPNYSWLFTLLEEYDKFIREQLAERDMLIANKDDVRKAMLNY